MNTASPSRRILSPLERFSEIVFGLIMVLSFTGALSVAESGREDIRTMLVGALGCNLAWGIIDAAFYLITCLVERGRDATLLRAVQQAPNLAEARQALRDALPEPVAEALPEPEYERLRAHLQELPPPAERPQFTGEDWRGAGGVFLLVFLSTLPVVLPFIFMTDTRLALRTSNLIAIAMLFGAGYNLAAYAGMRRLRTGLAMVFIGMALVSLTIVLGG